MKLFDKKIKIQEYTVKSTKIKNKFRIALVTDIHSEEYGKEMNELSNLVIDGKPDIVLLGGDICDKRFPKENTEKFLSNIHGKYPTYMVMGNHDYDFKGTNYVEDLMKKHRVTILSDNKKTIKINQNCLNICGIRDIRGIEYDHKKWEKTLDTFSTLHRNGNFTIFMVHRPEKVKKFLNRGFDLILCGHAHGGQWIVPNLINGLYAPGQGIFPKYAGGRYDFDKTTMIVCRGLAQHTTRIPRIMNPSELVFIDVVNDSD